MTSTQFDAVFVGIATIDTIALVDKYPESDSRTVTTNLERAGGGVAATAAVTAARLGAKVAFAGVVGADAVGAEIIDGLKAEGVNTDLIVVDSKSITATSAVIVSKSQSTRAIITRQDLNHNVCVTENLKRAVGRARILHVDHIGYHLLALMEIDRNSDLKISLDHGNKIAGLDPSWIDIYAPADVQLTELHPDLTIPQAILVQSERFEQDVIVTSGSKGSFAAIGKQSVHSPAIKTDVISTLGAGDVFHGALVVQYLEGRSAQEILDRANAVAGLSCRGLDGRSAIPSAAELDAYMKSK